LACQLASIAFRNPFQKRLQQLIAEWIPTSSDTEDSSDISTPNNNNHTLHVSPRDPCQLNISQADLVTMRKLSYADSFSEIRSRCSPEESQCVIENIIMLQRDFRNYHSTKKDITSMQSDTNESDTFADENLSPRKKSSVQKQLFQEDQSLSEASSAYRPPLLSLDINTMSNSSVGSQMQHHNMSFTSKSNSRTEETRWTKGSRNQIKRHERTLAMNARKLERQKPK
jgi:hypothetical protein